MQECTSRRLMDSCVVYVTPFLEKLNIKKYNLVKYMMDNVGQFCNPSDTVVFEFPHSIRAQGEIATYLSPPVCTQLYTPLHSLATALHY